jgi:hypothetical protein
MMNVKAGNVKMKGYALVRDKEGKPKIDRQSLKTFWPYLTEDDKEYMKTQYEEAKLWP